MTMEAALQAAVEIHDKRQESGFDQSALDDAARTGLANGEFEETEDEAGTVVDEFYPEEVLGGGCETQGTQRPSLADKLGSKLSGQAGAVS